MLRRSGCILPIWFPSVKPVVGADQTPSSTGENIFLNADKLDPADLMLVPVG